MYIPIVMLFCYIASQSTAQADLQEEGSSNFRVLGCGTDREVLLSNDRTLAPLELVQASSSVNSIGAHATRIYNSVLTWCTNDNDPDPYIDIQFTSPILVTMMISTGSTIINPNSMLGIYYVSNFTLEYSSPDNSSILSYYTSTADSATPEYFIVPNFTTLIQFKRPFLTQRIRLRPVDWFDSDGDIFTIQYLCQGVALYGCSQSRGQNSDTVKSKSNMEMATTLISVGIGAAIFGALLTVVMITAVVSIVCYCQQIRKRKVLVRQDSTIANTAYGIIHKRENIELEANKCYKSTQLISATPHERALGELLH